MGFSGDDRRKMNKEMWDRDLPPVEVPSIDESNDYRIDPVFDVYIGNMREGGTLFKKNKHSIIRHLKENLDKIHERGYTVKIMPNGKL